MNTNSQVGPGTRAKRPLDTLNFFLADVRDGLGPYLAIYLLTEQTWNEASIGMVMSIATIAGIVAQTPAGALIDATRAKRAVLITAALAVTGASLLLPWLSGFWAVAASQGVAHAAAAVFAPGIAAVTLGLVGRKAFSKRIGRNEAFNHAGNAFAAGAAGVSAYLWGPTVVFYLLAAMAIGSLVSALAIPADAIDHTLRRAPLSQRKVWARRSPRRSQALLSCMPATAPRSSHSAASPRLDLWCSWSPCLKPGRVRLRQPRQAERMLLPSQVRRSRNPGVGDAPLFTHSAIAAWSIAGFATAGVIVRPFRLPEAVWALMGATALVALRLLPWTDALEGVRKGLDVYLFLTGMMLIAELARQEGLFDWLAAFAVEHAHGSPQKLFTLVYAVGTVVTVFLSNDATAVVLTPAVYVAARAAGATPLPYLFACAFIANAASFVLPISNPANFVIYGERMPHLTAWLWQFGLPSATAVAVTYVALRLGLHRALASEQIAEKIERPRLSNGGQITAYGIGVVAVALLSCSALNLQLGLPTFICGALTTLVVLTVSRQSPLPIARGVAWEVLPLVAGLFVLVEALAHTGVIASIGRALHDATTSSVTGATWAAAILTGLGGNMMNNLPVALIAGSVVAADDLPQQVIGAMLIGVDLGPNLSVTGSLATILWLVSLRREGVEVGTRDFLRLSLLTMPPALALSIIPLLVRA
jgi:arsenical pump membrane protein